MPRRSKNMKNDETLVDKPAKKTLMNTIVKDITVVENEDIILQLPISEAQILEINNEDKVSYSVPEPYEPNCCYIGDNNTYQNIQNNYVANQQFDEGFEQNVIKSSNNCYWCCYPIENRTYGMPYKYNTTTDTYTLYGNFCSLECASAYNFSANNGSDKVWEINSFIQMLSKHYGIKQAVRPAPSRFLLKLFNGPMSIEEFRTAHLTNDKTHIINLPPMISTNFNYEAVNTSYLKNITDNMNIMKNASSIPIKKQAKNTIDSKLNLIIS
jgi:hypothetical protein